jgi:GntR family transcriptional regulator/MocR family aminotransferase
VPGPRSHRAGARRRKRRSRVAPAAYSFLAFDRTASVPIYVQLTNRIRNAIRSGELAPGTRLPSTREIAGDLGVSRNTASNAFDTLMSEGYVEGRLGSGTYVVEILPDDCLAAPAAPAESGVATRRPRLSRRAGRIAELLDPLALAPPNATAFRMSTPALDAFPHETWARLASRTRALPPRVTLGYGDPAGFAPLRQAVAEYVRVARGATCDAGQVVITSGAQQGLALAIRALLDPGDAAWIEDPGYPGAYLAVEGAGGVAVPVPVDEAGIDVDAGRAAEPGARVAYVTPSHQFPLGVTMSEERRARLLEWARAADAWILEDDYDSEYRYTTRPAASLQGADATARVLLVGTFSKVLFPSLRLGYLVLPTDLVDPLLSARFADVPPTADQITLAEFISEGHFYTHVRRMRALYAERREILLDELGRTLGDAITPDPSDAGMFLVAGLDEAVSDLAVSKAASELGLDAQALSPFYAAARPRNGLLLGYACVGRRDARRGVETLARAIEIVRSSRQ